MANKFTHIGIATILVALLVLLSDPFMVWMPAPTVMLVLLGVTILALVWSGFVMYERSEDERENIHAMFAGRVAYLLGIGVLTLGLIVQGLQHSIDPWILLALGSMVVSKLVARLYSDRYK